MTSSFSHFFGALWIRSEFDHGFRHSLNVPFTNEDTGCSIDDVFWNSVVKGGNDGHFQKGSFCRAQSKSFLVTIGCCDAVLAKDVVFFDFFFGLVLRQCSKQCHSSDALVVDHGFDGAPQRAVTNEGEGGVGDALFRLFECQQGLNGAFLFHQSTHVNEAGVSVPCRFFWNPFFGFYRESDNVALFRSNSRYNAQVFGVMGSADDATGLIGDPNEFCSIPVVTKLTADVISMHCDEERQIQFFNHIGTVVRRGAVLNPKKVSFEILKRLQELFHAALPLFHDPKVLFEGASQQDSGEAPRDVVELTVVHVGKAVGWAGHSAMSLNVTESP